MSKTLSAKFRHGPVVLVSKAIEFTFPLAYAYLAGYLREMGEDVQVLFRPSHSDFGQFIKQIMSLNPLLVGFGSLYPELTEVRELIQLLDKSGREFPIVIGGQMVSPTPKFAVEVTGADMGIIGEGEIILYNLVNALRHGRNPATVKGLAVKDGSDILLTGPGEYIADLTKLPPIPYDLFPQQQWLEIGRWYTRHFPQPQWRFTDRAINVHAGRGCPFSCNFCYHHSRARYRPLDVAIGEAAEALERFDANMLYFSDETSLPSPKRVREMLHEIRRLKRPIEYSVSSRFDILDNIDDELLLEMKQTGCRIMGLGIESGSDRILKLIGKNFSLKTVLRGLERLNAVNILPTVSIMVGQYTETAEDVEASIALVRESVRNNRNIQYAFTIATPFPGSELYKLIFQKGILRDEKEFYERYFQSREVFQAVVNLSDMSDKEMMAMYAKIQQTYMEEKTKGTRASVNAVEYAMQKFSAGHERIAENIFKKFREHSVLYRISGVAILDKFYQWTYNFVQKNLDMLRLKLRGIIVSKR